MGWEARHERTQNSDPNPTRVLMGICGFHTQGASCEMYFVVLVEHHVPIIYSRVFAKNTSGSRYLGTCALNVDSDDSNNQWQLL